MQILQKISSALRSFKEGIENLWMWFPIIWKDRQFDYAYLERMLLYKMELMYDRFSDPDETMVDWEYGRSGCALQALRICITILERRQEDFYTTSLCDSNTRELTDELMVQIHLVERRDWKILHTLMEQYSEYWWD